MSYQVPEEEEIIEDTIKISRRDYEDLINNGNKYSEKEPRKSTYVKLKPFGGTLKEDIDAWLFNFRIWKVALGASNEKQLIVIAASNLEKNANAWFQSWFDTLDEPYLSWRVFETEIKKLFQSPQRKRRLRDELYEVKQRNSVIEYAEKLQRIRTAIGSVAEEEALEKFIRGLKVNIRNIGLVQDPSYLSEAMKMAETFDAGSSRPWLKLNNPSINWRNDIISFDETPPLLLKHIEIKDMVGFRAINEYLLQN
ncbi:hypothetical protein AYI68_g8334 [Smittium mucronatum]|uniref:Ty3 transposon capsid-like protein domain-containing protein n=1 Tax=Smittium mucronatum TaxID=133383 RepID=A0A1R0GL70_9FUNG|nr:hypothetical protein AYI68_g8334 [Smittium mucronatum]